MAHIGNWGTLASVLVGSAATVWVAATPLDADGAHALYGRFEPLVNGRTEDGESVRVVVRRAVLEVWTGGNLSPDERVSVAELCGGLAQSLALADLGGIATWAANAKVDAALEGRTAGATPWTALSTAGISVLDPLGSMPPEGSGAESGPGSAPASGGGVPMDARYPLLGHYQAFARMGAGEAAGHGEPHHEFLHAQRAGPGAGPVYVNLPVETGGRRCLLTFVLRGGLGEPWRVTLLGVIADDRSATLLAPFF